MDELNIKNGNNVSMQSSGKNPTGDPIGSMQLALNMIEAISNIDATSNIITSYLIKVNYIDKSECIDSIDINIKQD